MRRRRGERGAGTVGCIVWLVILGLIGYLMYKVIPVKIENSEFADFLQDEAAFGSIKSQQQLQAEILNKAKDMKLPVNRDNLIIKKNRESITIEAHYEITVDFFNGSYKYVWKFDPVYSRPLFNV